MAIDATDADRGAVDKELVAAHLDPPEPDPPPIRLRLTRVPGKDDLEVVPHGLLGRPRAHLEGSRPSRTGVLPVAVDRPVRGTAPGDLPGGVADRHREVEAFGPRGPLDHVHRGARATPSPAPDPSPPSRSSWPRWSGGVEKRKTSRQIPSRDMWAYQLMSSSTAYGVYSVSVIASSFSPGSEERRQLDVE